MFGKKKNFKEKTIKNIEKKKTEIKKLQHKEENTLDNNKKIKIENKIKSIEEEISKMAKLALNKDGKLEKVDEIKTDDKVDIIEKEEVAKLVDEKEIVQSVSAGNAAPPLPVAQQVQPQAPPVQEQMAQQMHPTEAEQQQAEIAQIQAEQQANAIHQQAQMQQQVPPEDLFPPELMQEPQSVQRPIMPSQIPPEQFVSNVNIPEQPIGQDVKIKIVLVGGESFDYGFNSATAGQAVNKISEAMTNNESIQLGKRIFNSRNILFFEF